MTLYLVQEAAVSSSLKYEMNCSRYSRCDGSSYLYFGQDGEVRSCAHRMAEIASTGHIRDRFPPSLYEERPFDPHAECGGLHWDAS